MKAVLLPLLLALSSCSVLTDAEDAATLTISVNSGTSSLPWPRGSETRQVLFNSLGDDRGFAGLEIEISSPAWDTAWDTVFTVADFRDHAPSFEVPDSGRLRIFARLVQAGRVVAEGSGSWMLKQGAEWWVRVNRAPYPPTEGVFSLTEAGTGRCAWFWCIANWRFPVAEEAANYEMEALWLTLERHDVCADVC